MIKAEYLKKSVIAALWLIFLTFPIAVIKVNTIENTINWRWMNALFAGIAGFLFSYIWNYFQDRKNSPKKKSASSDRLVLLGNIAQTKSVKNAFYVSVAVLAAVVPFAGPYQTTIFTSAMLYIILGLGLNIAVGMAGLLHLGYAAFYAVGAYTYALLHIHYGIGFWLALPIGGLVAAIFGIILGLPVLRLKGDYLAIVTLGFGEIVRIVLENWNEFSKGPSGISEIPGPWFFGMKLNSYQHIMYIYYVALMLTILVIVFTNRLQSSRIGRALMAMREDEIASEAMGIDITKTKLTAFAFSAAIAGVAGVLFAAKTTFINPQSFTFMESAIILSIVVLGGMGSITGVIIAALVLILLPEYLRELGNYRMIIFGASMVLMMLFRPQGLISNVRKIYKI